MKRKNKNFLNRNNSLMICHGEITHRLGDACVLCNKVKEAYEDIHNRWNELPPIGVSQWREYGKKYGYWDYFKGLLTDDLLVDIDKINTDGGGNGRRIIEQVKQLINEI